MIVRHFQDCVYRGITTVIFLQSAFGINNILNSAQALGDGSNNVDALDPFDPSFMDPGNFNAEKKPSPGTNTCRIDNIECNSSSPYRTYDGTCNNLAHPTWGMAEDCHPRILEAQYEGEYDLRRSVQGGPLPATRDMVLKGFENRNRPTHNASLLLTILGQLVAHEITDRRIQIDFTETCCSGANEKNTSLCAPIYVPPDDPFYSKFNVTCLECYRTSPCPRCISDKRQTLNTVTAALDGSVIYGISEEKALYLRTLDGTGRMRVETTEFGDLLASTLESDRPPSWCPAKDKAFCFKGGDPRVNQHSTLTSVSTLLVREHNNVVDRLGKLNPGWDDETRYQEARRIVTAELQNIVHSEYLPALLGPAHMSHYNLSVHANRNGTRYDPSIRIGIWNEFSTSLFKLHSMVATRVGFDHYRFKDYFANPKLLWEGKMDKIIQGLCKVPSQKNDNWFPKDISEHLPLPLLQDHNMPFGDDLVAIDLQRGRDNGIAPYVDVLGLLTGGRMNVTKYNDLSPLMPRMNIRILEKLYKDVRDVDLFAGALMENFVPGANLGPTSASVVSMQFNNIKFGDRFYFEHEGEAGSFSPDQREALKKTTLARVLCDNLRIRSIQRYPFYLESKKNPVVNCGKIPPSLDLSPWSIPQN